MHVLDVVDVNEALPRGLAYLRDEGIPEVSRNGPALVAPGPVATVYRYPRCRVLFDPKRDANPFFHLFESLWILAGREDVEFLSWFNKRMADYSDDGQKFHAPYGYRLRYAFGFDQVDRVCDELRASPSSRRAVLQIWQATKDLGAVTKDLPCNDLVMTRVRKGDTLHPSRKVLDITVCNRSNDAIWGAYGANAVQFSFLQEYMANKIGVGVGEYTQMSHNFHVYTENVFWVKWLNENRGGVHVPMYPYYSAEDQANITPLLSMDEDPHDFDADLFHFFRLVNSAGTAANLSRSVYGVSFRTMFFRHTVTPMLGLWVNRQTRALDLDTDKDWIYAGVQWVNRRFAEKERDAT